MSIITDELNDVSRANGSRLKRRQLVSPRSDYIQSVCVAPIKYG